MGFPAIYLQQPQAGMGRLSASTPGEKNLVKTAFFTYPMMTRTLGVLGSFTPEWRCRTIMTTFTRQTTVAGREARGMTMKCAGLPMCILLKGTKVLKQWGFMPLLRMRCMSCILPEILMVLDHLRAVGFSSQGAWKKKDTTPLIWKSLSGCLRENGSR